MSSFERFEFVLSTGGVEVELAALEMAAVFRPGLDVAEWTERLDELASGCDADIASVSEHLFVEQGFDGNRCGYYDPLNSWLDVVIERRTGIPISLSIVVMAVARRVGLEVVGIGMPSHFLARDLSTGLYVDAFGGGSLLDHDGVLGLFQSLHGTEPFHDSMLEPVGVVPIVRRMLNNLANIAQMERDAELRVTATRLRSLLPDATTGDRLDLAGALLARGDVRQAADALDAAAAGAPEHEHDALARFASEVRGRLN